MKKQNGKDKFNGNGYHKYACIIVSKDEFDLAERIKSYVEKTDNIYVKYYIISKKHIEKLEKVGISLEGAGCHHFVPQTLSSQVKIHLKNERNNEKINTLKALAAEMDFCLVISMPNFIHQNHNRVFAGDFTPEEVLKKLEWILDPKREFANGWKIDIINMFSLVSIFSGKDVECGLDLEYVASLKENEKAIIPNDLMEVFNIKKENIIRYLENFFFYPGHEEFYKHFKLLSELRTSDRIRKSHLEIYNKYESQY